MGSARSKKWGMNERPNFNSEKDALDWARQIAEQIEKSGSVSDVPKEKIVLANRYEKMVERLTRFDKTPEQAIDHFVKFLGDEILRQAMPTIRQLVEQWEAYKLLDSTLDEQYRNEIKLHCRFIKHKWGKQRADEIRKNEIETILKKHPGSNNTRRKYLTFIRMFFKWVLAEDRGYIVTNPAIGIRFKAERFEKEFHPPETLKKFLRFVAEKQRPLVGYYALLAFVGLRPSEAARVQWHHVGFSTNELHVIKGKTDARHVHLEPVAIAWLKWHRENSPKDGPFVPQKNLFNLERKVRASMNGQWIADGLRHGFATFYASLKKDYPAVAWYMGNSVAMIKKHYAKTVPGGELEKFWGLTPEVVLKTD